VGTVATSRRARKSYGDRLALALRLLEDARLDALLNSRSSLTELPARMAEITRPEAGVLCHVVVYE